MNISTFRLYLVFFSYTTILQLNKTKKNWC